MTVRRVHRLLFAMLCLALVWGATPQDLRADQPTAPAKAKPESPRDARRDAHIELIRALQSEIAVAKVALPRGKHGIYVNGQGKVDQGKANAELKENGPAIKPGMPVEITHMAFKGNDVIFEINHGGKSGKKWYQHIYVGMGTADQPLVPDNSPVLAYGSWITLKAPGKIADLTAVQVRKLLATVLDFERHAPTVLYSASTPPKFKDAIKKHQVVVGMDRDAVLSAKGTPDRKVREEKEGSEQEDWIYGLPPHVLFVVFDGDIVSSVRQY